MYFDIDFVNINKTIYVYNCKFKINTKNNNY